MEPVVSGVINLAIEDGKVDCPQFEQKTSFEDCRMCPYMREQRTQASEPMGKSISGSLVCEYKKYHK